MKNYTTLILGIALTLLNSTGGFAESTVISPHPIGKSRLRIRIVTMYIHAQKCYSDEVWKALHDESPYSKDYDKMVELPVGWHMRTSQVAIAFEYGITDRLSVGALLPYVTKDVRRQVWSKNANETVWKEINESGFNDVWFITKALVYSNAHGPFGFNWKDGLTVALAYKPSISPDEKIKNGIGDGSNDFRILLLSMPRLTEKLFLSPKIWYQYTGKVKDISGFSKSGWKEGNRFGYRFFVGYKVSHKLAVVGGLQGWIAGSNKDKNGKEIEDSDTYFHLMVTKLIWRPSKKIIITSGVKMPFAYKVPFAPALIPFFYFSYVIG